MLSSETQSNVSPPSQAGSETRVDTASSVVHWAIDELHGLLGEAELKYESATWYGTNPSGRAAAECLEDRCAFIADSKIREYGRGDLFTTGETKGLIQDRIDATRIFDMTGGIASDAKAYAQHTPVKSVRNIRKITDEIEHHENGLLVLLTREDPTKQPSGLSRYVPNFSSVSEPENETITDLRIVVSTANLPPDSEGNSETMNERRNKLKRCHNHYFAHKCSHEYPDFHFAQEIVRYHLGCGVTKLWNGALNHFGAFEEVGFDSQDVKLMRTENSAWPGQDDSSVSFGATGAIAQSEHKSTHSSKSDSPTRATGHQTNKSATPSKEASPNDFEWDDW
ncbi:hypothetical protein I302_100880 [Kwoniella bestiolae CBS 10118]|uniref:Uncharacterized protein n=1 Tax=Kwoniella bestiolae CBS 10118 TaxID=1296100 RepID=A0AAJ8K179_9TREE